MVIDECIVHSGQTATEFYCAVNQLRREKKFHTDIYQQLPDRCCSCDGKSGLATIDLNALRKICHDILLSWAFKNHVPFTKNLNKLILKKRGKSKKKQIAKNTIKNELRDKCDEYDPWYDDDEVLCSERSHRKKRLDKSKGMISQLSISSKYFKATVVFYGCIVHGLQYIHEFHRGVTELRLVSDFPSSVYYQLLEKCCSCNGKKGLNVIDPMILRDICYGIEAEQPVQQVPEGLVHLITLPFGSTIDLPERRRKIGLFIGKKGRHLHAVQNKYNVRVNIVTESSSEQLRQNLIKLLRNSGIRRGYNGNELYSLLTTMDRSVDETIVVAEIRQIFEDKWNKISESEHFKKRSGSIR